MFTRRKAASISNMCSGLRLMSEINIMIWNAQSIHNKEIELTDVLLDENIDIALITETWLRTTDRLKINTFNIYRNDRHGRRGGGVAILSAKLSNTSNYKIYKQQTWRQQL